MPHAGEPPKPSKADAPLNAAAAAPKAAVPPRPPKCGEGIAGGTGGPPNDALVEPLVEPESLSEVMNLPTVINYLTMADLSTMSPSLDSD